METGKVNILIPTPNAQQKVGFNQDRSVSCQFCVFAVVFAVLCVCSCVCSFVCLCMDVLTLLCVKYCNDFVSKYVLLVVCQSCSHICHYTHNQQVSLSIQVCVQPQLQH